MHASFVWSLDWVSGYAGHLDTFEGSRPQEMFSHLSAINSLHRWVLGVSQVITSFWAISIALLRPLDCIYRLSAYEIGFV